MAEEKIKNILTDEKLSAIKAVLEKDHAIDCIEIDSERVRTRGINMARRRTFARTIS